MTKLRDLHISLEHTDIKQIGQTKLFKSLNNIRYLEVLKLNFGKTTISGDLPLEALANSLCSMTSLREFSAEFFDTNVSDKAF